MNNQLVVDGCMSFTHKNKRTLKLYTSFINNKLTQKKEKKIPRTLHTNFGNLHTKFDNG